MVLENRYLFYKIIVISQILDRENQIEPLREFRIREYNKRLYSRIIKGLDRGRLIELRSIYYNYLVKKTNQKSRNQRKDRLEN